MAERPLARHSAAFALYLLAAVLLFDGTAILSHPSSRILGGNSADTDFFLWALRWWPHAAGHLTDPFLSRAIWAPTGYNVTWSTSIPLPSMIVAPITVWAGPVVSFNVLSLLAPVSAAWTAYLLASHITKAAPPALVAGFLFGFSPYEVNTLASGHLDLSLVFVLPLLAYLIVRHLEGSIGSRRFIALLGIALAAQFLIFVEVFATATIMAALTALVGLVFAKQAWRRRIVRTAGHVVGAYAVAAVLVSPVLVAMLAYPRPGRNHAALGDLAHSSRSWRTTLSFIEPGSGTAIGGSICHCGRNGIYLSLPVLAILLLAFVGGRRLAAAWTFAVLFVLAVTLALGPALRIGRHYVVLPWRWVGALPTLDLATPGRMIAYAFLLAGATIAVWWSSRRSVLRTGLVGLAVVALLPAFWGQHWSGDLRLPAFIASGQYRAFLHTGDTVIVIGPRKGEDVLWQAETDMYFRIAGGYVGNTPPDFVGSEFVARLFRGNVEPSQIPDLDRFLAVHRVKAVIVDARSDAYITALASWLGVQPQSVGGVVVFPLSPAGP